MRRASSATPGSTSLSPVLVQGGSPSHQRRITFVLVCLLRITRTKELNKRDRAAHEIFSTTQYTLPFFLLSQNTLMELRAKANQTLPVRMNRRMNSAGPN